MGYESKIIVGLKNNLTESIYIEQLAQMNLSKVGYDFAKIFTTELESELVGDNEFTYKTDCYGDVCKYADIETVIKWLENAEAKEHYRRFLPAIAMLKAYANEKWHGELIVIHFGY